MNIFCLNLNMKMIEVENRTDYNHETLVNEDHANKQGRQNKWREKQ